MTGYATIHATILTVALVWALLLVLGFLAAALRGGSLLDRALAVDLVGLSIVAVLALLAIGLRDPAYLDAAIALALLAFVGTVAAAQLRGPGGPL